mmetsp:Transcript_47137/g.118724  ORF Transcript_47137/g.118724 Transcript_47137/m.118724 type:complete len:208 (+) Transcript_47137:168-791(+)
MPVLSHWGISTPTGVYAGLRKCAPPPDASEWNTTSNQSTVLRRVCSIWRSRSESNRKVPYLQEYKWCIMVMRKSSLNSNAVGNCTASCCTLSTNWRKIGASSSLSTDDLSWRMPWRVLKGYPIWIHSFSIMARKPTNVRACGSAITCTSEQTCALRSLPLPHRTHTLMPPRTSMSVTSTATRMTVHSWWSHPVECSPLASCASSTWY